MCHMASLPDKATDNLGGIGNHSPRRNDKILCDNTVANIYRGILITIDRTVIKTSTVFDRRIIGNYSIAHSPRIDYFHMVTDKAIATSLQVGKVGNHSLQTMYQGRTMTVQGYKIGQ